MADGQVIVPKGLKTPPLDIRKKQGFCKYHNFLGHKTSQCVLFRDLVQDAIEEGRLKFSDKPKPQMKIDSDPLQVEEANLVEPVEMLVVETDTAKVVQIRDAMKVCSHEVMMVQIVDNLNTHVKEVTK